MIESTCVAETDSARAIVCALRVQQGRKVSVHEQCLGRRLSCPHSYRRKPPKVLATFKSGASLAKPFIRGPNYLLRSFFFLLRQHRALNRIPKIIISVVLLTIASAGGSAPHTIAAIPNVNKIVRYGPQLRWPRETGQGGSLSPNQKHDPENVHETTSA